MIAVNVIFVPRIGYRACAWGGFAGYGTAMLLSWLIGRGKYPVPYDMKAIGGFTLLAAVIFVAVSLPGWCGGSLTPWVQMLGGTVLLLGYAALAWRQIRNSRRRSRS